MTETLKIWSTTIPPLRVLIKVQNRTHLHPSSPPSSLARCSSSPPASSPIFFVDISIASNNSDLVPLDRPFSQLARAFVPAPELFAAVNADRLGSSASRFFALASRLGFGSAFYPIAGGSSCADGGGRYYAASWIMALSVQWPNCSVLVRSGILFPSTLASAAQSLMLQASGVTRSLLQTRHPQL